ncbi:phospholipase D-like domain-containing protein [Aurantibacillus circumpalustris]|uniref:phospholipase D-like domain-containing protein n=1 Tax=Aurantibacillus circumpalustris TaxID=3036359 RepID=UPI00295BADFF|nr:phospholipase D-like domain-containing protein [Aurantibacillus circumpalustris]
MKKYLDAEDIQLVLSGKNYFEVLENIINQSEKTLHLQTYIFETDETGLKIIDCLKNAAKRNVEVYVLSDAYGSFAFDSDVEQHLRKSGIHFRLYSPLFSSESGFFGRRLHHKIVVADKRTALVGGINIANKYLLSGQEEAWLDYSVLVKGEVCEYLHLLCEATYARKRKRVLISWENKMQSNNLRNSKLIRFRRNDFIKRKNEVHQGYVENIRNAKTSIIIVASYFLPGNNFRRLLRRAAARGVKIKIILAGKSDVDSVKLAQHYLYEFYLKHGIEIFEWQNSILHGKAMMVDNSWVTIGSYNLNFLSHYISIELNAEIQDRNFTSVFSSHIENILRKDCAHIQLDKFLKKLNYFNRIKIKLAYILHRSIMNIVMFGKNKK